MWDGVAFLDEDDEDEEKNDVDDDGPDDGEVDDKVIDDGVDEDDDDVTRILFLLRGGTAKYKPKVYFTHAYMSQKTCHILSHYVCHETIHNKTVEQFFTFQTNYRQLMYVFNVSFTNV